MPLFIALVLLLAVPVPARAIDVPSEVQPGQRVVVAGGPGLVGGVVTLRPDDERIVVGVVGTPFVWPESYAGRRFYPGQRVPLDACSLPITGGVPGLLTSSQFCEGTSTVIARVDGVRLKRLARLAGMRWSGWGEAMARGRGNRGLRATAFRVIECDGELWYSAVDLRSGRRVQRLRGLAPC